MFIETMEPIPAGDNPFHHDFYHMGVNLDRRYILMYHDHDENKYFIICDTKTGARHKVVLDEEKQKEEAIANLMQTVLR